MEKLKKINKSLSLRKFFIVIIFTTFIIVIFLSLLCIYCGIKFRDYLLPDSNTILITLVIKNKEGQTYNVDYETKLGEEMSSIPALMNDSGEESDYISISDIQAAVVTAHSDLSGSGRHISRTTFCPPWVYLQLSNQRMLHQC